MNIEQRVRSLEIEVDLMQASPAIVAIQPSSRLIAVAKATLIELRKFQAIHQSEIEDHPDESRDYAEVVSTLPALEKALKDF